MFLRYTDNWFLRLSANMLIFQREMVWWKNDQISWPCKDEIQELTCWFIQLAPTAKFEDLRVLFSSVQIKR